MTCLLPFLPFKADETPLSWAARLASLHTGGRLTPFLNDLGISYVSTIEGASDAIARLCDATGQDPTPVLRNTVQKIEHRRYSLRGQTLYAEMLVTPDTQFCPACLAADSEADLPDNVTRYGRLSWRLKTTRTCPTHHIPLIVRRSGRWDDRLSELAVIVPENNDALHMLSAMEVRRTPSPLQGYVLDRLDGAKTSVWLDSLSLDLAATVTEKLGAILTFGTRAQPRRLNREDWDAAGAAGWPFTSRDEDGVCEALALMQRRAAKLHPNGLSKSDIFGMMYPWLTNHRTLKDLEPVRRVFRAHYNATMTGLPNDLVFGKPLENPQFSTPNKVAMLEKVDPRTLRNLLVGKGFISVDADLDVRVSFADAVKAAQEMNRAVSAKKGIAMLNTSRPVWKILIDGGYLSAIGSGGEYSTVRCKAVDQACINHLLLRVENLTDQFDIAPTNYRDLAKCAEICKVPLDLIIPAFLDGQMKTAIRLKSVKGIKSVLLNTEEVAAVIGTSARAD